MTSQLVDMFAEALGENPKPSKPLPCPFCGHLYAYPTSVTKGGAKEPECKTYWYRCPGCMAMGPMADTAGDALKLWNMRSSAAV